MSGSSTTLSTVSWRSSRLRVENHRIEPLRTETSPLAPPINSAATAPLTLGCQTTTGSCTVYLSYLEEVLTWDHRDKLLEPRKYRFVAMANTRNAKSPHKHVTFRVVKG